MVADAGILLGRSAKCLGLRRHDSVGRTYRSRAGWRDDRAALDLDWRKAPTPRGDRSSCSTLGYGDIYGRIVCLVARLGDRNLRAGIRSARVVQSHPRQRRGHPLHRRLRHLGASCIVPLGAIH